MTLIAGGVQAAPPEALRLAVAEIPASRSNPFATVYIPGLYVWSAVYDTLTRLSPEDGLAPWLAASWRATSPTTWEFKLREGVTFANGAPFTADAVVVAVTYLATGPGVNDPTGRDLATLAGARAIDAHTVEITTDQPNPTLPREISYMLIPAPGAWAQTGLRGLQSAPSGTGPYAVERWSEERIVLTAAAASWRKAQTRRLEIYPSPDAAARIQGLLAGQFDVIVDIAPDEDQALARAGARLAPVRWPGVWAVMFNTEKDPRLRDVRVRRALNLAVDRQTIISQLLAGATVPAGQPASRDAEGYNPELPAFPFDPMRAKALLAEAGYPNGLSLVMESISGAGANDALVSQRVAADLAKVGVAIEVRTLAVVQLLDRMQKGTWQGSLFPTSFFMPTQDALRAMRMNSCLWHMPWYCDRDIMPTLEAGLTESDPERRRALARQVMARSHDQAQALFLYEGLGFMGLAGRVTHLRSDFGFLRYEDIAFAP
jgi:peptide/nickel transport system substrate-binding protein